MTVGTKKLRFFLLGEEVFDYYEKRILVLIFFERSEEVFDYFENFYSWFNKLIFTL